jgi:hypothetical protein
MAKKRRRPKVKFDTSFNFGANVGPKKPRASRPGRRGRWSKYGGGS